MIRIQKCTVREFGELIKEKQVICFGGGQRLLDICEAYTMIDVESAPTAEIIEALEKIEGVFRVRVVK